MKILIVGIGNPGRRDDGLGPALVERLAGIRPPERAVVKTADGSADAFWTYQLNIEDAAVVREYDRVVFADATVDAATRAEPGQELPGLTVLPARGERAGPTRPLGVRMRPLAPAATIAFTTHEMAPASVLALGEELYGRRPEGFLLAIRGSEWDLAEGISAEAGRTLAEAERLFREFSGLPRPR